jgi:hypothetical protein
VSEWSPRSSAQSRYSTHRATDFQLMLAGGSRYTEG